MTRVQVQSEALVILCLDQKVAMTKTLIAVLRLLLVSLFYTSVLLLAPQVTVRAAPTGRPLPRRKRMERVAHVQS